MFEYKIKQKISLVLMKSCYEYQCEGCEPVSSLNTLTLTQTHTIRHPHTGAAAQGF